MDDMRTCGNGHVFPAREGSCPHCDSVASRPATRAEMEEAGFAGTSADRGSREADMSGRLGTYLTVGVVLVLAAAGLASAAVYAGSTAVVVIAYLATLAGVLLVLYGIIGLGVRDGITAHDQRRERRAAREKR